MKILIIRDWPSAEFIHRGYWLAQNLVELGDEVHYLVWDPYPYPKDISGIRKNLLSSFKYIAYIKDGIMIHTIRRLPFPFPPINRYMSKKLISQISARVGLDVIISGCFNNEVEPPFDLPLIYDLWDHNEAYLAEWESNILRRFALKYILNIRKSVHTQIKHAAVVTAVSNILVDYARKINPDIPVHKIPNGVDSLFLEAPLEARERRFGKHSMVYVSLFSQWTNLPKLIEATWLVKRGYPDIRLVLVGEGRGRIISDAKQLVASLGLSEDVEFLGRLEREEIPSILNSCEIALCPFQKSLHTDAGFPVKIMEYTALGKKIVSSNLEEVKLLDFPNIVVYDESKGVEELANAIVKAFTADIDPSETRKLAYKYTWKGIAGQFQSVLRELVEQRKDQANKGE